MEAQKYGKISSIKKELNDIEGTLIWDPGDEYANKGEYPATIINNPDIELSGTELFDLNEGQTSDDIAPPDPNPIFEIPADIEEKNIENILSRDTGYDIRKQIEIKSIDALGWYTPFHQEKYQWGVHISGIGVYKLAVTAFENIDCSLQKKIELSNAAISRHEIFHFSSEYMQSQWELNVGLPCYWPTTSLIDKILGYFPKEERLANAYMLRGFRWPSNVTREKNSFRSLANWTKFAPEGYRDGILDVPKTEFHVGCSELSQIYQNCMKRNYNAPLNGLDHVSLFGGFPKIDWRYCPIIFVHDETKLGLPPISVRFINSIQQIEESRKFKKSMKSLGKKFREKVGEN